MFLKDNQRGMNGSSRPTARASVTPCPPPHPTHPPTCLLQTISLPPGEAWEEVERQLGTNIATQAIALFRWSKIWPKIAQVDKKLFGLMH